MQRRRDRSKDNERQPLPLNLGFRAMGMNCHRGGQSRRQAWWNWHQGSAARIPVWDGHASLEGAAKSARRREKRSPARSRRAPPHHFKSHKTPWCLRGLASSPSYGYILTCFGSAQQLADSNGHFMRHHRCQIYTYIYISDYTVDGTLPAAPTVLAKKSFRRCASGVAVALQQTAGTALPTPPGPSTPCTPPAILALFCTLHLVLQAFTTGNISALSERSPLYPSGRTAMSSMPSGFFSTNPHQTPYASVISNPQTFRTNHKMQRGRNRSKDLTKGNHRHSIWKC